MVSLRASQQGVTAFSNVFADTERAQAYATLGFPGTYFLAYRGLPALIAEHVTGALPYTPPPYHRRITRSAGLPWGE